MQGIRPCRAATRKKATAVVRRLTACDVLHASHVKQEFLSLKLQLGKYTPLMELASGGMATVYVARQAGPGGFGRVVVVKRVHRHLLQDPELRTMLLDEAKVTSLIRHSNVVSVSDVVESENELSLIMDYVESASLATLISAYKKAGEPMPAAIACRIIVDVLAGLHAAHEAKDATGTKMGIVHRDVSPQNVIVGVDGHSRVVDFGIAKAAHRVTETRRGDVLGKLPYMSPEQLLGRSVDRRVDVFAAGVVLHETLTGKRLFSGKTDAETLYHVLNKEIPNPSSLTDAPPALDAVVQKALARAPQDRYATTREFIAAIEAAVPLASPRAVTAAVEVKCWKLLAKRRIELSAALAEQPKARTDMFDDSLSRSYDTGLTSVVDAKSGALDVPKRTKLTFALGAAILVAGVLVGAVVESTGARGLPAAAGQDELAAGLAPTAAGAAGAARPRNTCEVTPKSRADTTYVHSPGRGGTK